ncbi:MAG: ammonium transporter [Thiotrichales bacterium]|nr:ammonium transporter [Thiotrichales bacterium]
MERETQFVLDTFSFLVWGGLVMWMCAGFTMLEAGSVRTKNASVICLKNIGLYSIACLTFYLIGYNLMFGGVEEGGWIGSLDLLHGPADEERALLGGDLSAAAAVVNKGHATMSDWLFQMVFMASAASIVSGTLAERVKLWSFFVFIVVLTAVIYPIVGAWTWGGGWLDALGFQDFAGSTVVHSTGGWAALAGVLVIGARKGKFRKDGTVKSTPPANVPAVTLGVFIIWLGFLGFNGGSQLALSGASDAVAIGNVLVNTNLAAAAGVMTALVLSRPVFGHVDLLASLNGAISGLVAITAGPDIVDHSWAIVIGATGAAVCTLGMKLLHLLRIDDEVGAIPAHMGAGVWGTLAVCIAAGGDPLVQLIGVTTIGIFVFGTSLLAWQLIDMTLGARILPRVEELGQDFAELGIEAFPEFMLVKEE